MGLRGEEVEARLGCLAASGGSPLLPNSVLKGFITCKFNEYNILVNCLEKQSILLFTAIFFLIPEYYLSKKFQNQLSIPDRPVSASLRFGATSSGPCGLTATRQAKQPFLTRLRPPASPFHMDFLLPSEHFIRNGICEAWLVPFSASA